MIRKDDIVTTSRCLVRQHTKNEEALCRVIRALAGIGDNRASTADFIAAIEHAAEGKGSEVVDEPQVEEVAPVVEAPVVEAPVEVEEDAADEDEE